jgi:hypothetical protein
MLLVTDSNLNSILHSIYQFTKKENLNVSCVNQSSLHRGILKDTFHLTMINTNLLNVKFVTKPLELDITINVVAFQRWWVLKSKLFAQESTSSKEILIVTTLNHL